MKTVKIELELTEEEADQFAVFLRRSNWSTYEALSDPTDRTEPQRFADAVCAVQRGLREAGFAPR